MPKISIIIPIYKVEKYLPRCIDSILSQSFQDYELILIDDGSPDQCGAICDAYAEKDDRIIVIHQENANASASRNAGINISRGEWLAFIDPDDWIHREYLRLLYEGAEEDTDIVICDCLVTDSETEIDCDSSQVCFVTNSFEEIKKNHIASKRVWGRLIRKTTVGALRFITGAEPIEDSYFNELLFDKEMKFRVTDAKLYYYFMRPDSAIHVNLGRRSLNTIVPMIEQLATINNPEKRMQIIQRCYKNVLYPRYLEMYTPDYETVLIKCQELFTLLKPHLKELNLKDRTVFSMFTAFPQLYRWWRIITDPTLLDYEKKQKANNRNNSVITLHYSQNSLIVRFNNNSRG